MLLINEYFQKKKEVRKHHWKTPLVLATCASFQTCIN